MERTSDIHNFHNIHNIDSTEDKGVYNDINIKDLSSLINNLENKGNIIYINNDCNIDKEQTSSKAKSKKKNRCSHIDCKKKLSLIDLEKKCSCQQSFCMKHFQPFNHNCDFDHKSKTKKIIKENNPKCENIKFEKM